MRWPGWPPTSLTLLSFRWFWSLGFWKLRVAWLLLLDRELIQNPFRSNAARRVDWLQLKVKKQTFLPSVFRPPGRITSWYPFSRFRSLLGNLVPFLGYLLASLLPPPFCGIVSIGVSKHCRLSRVASVVFSPLLSMSFFFMLASLYVLICFLLFSAS